MKVLLINPSFQAHRQEPEIPDTLEKKGSLEIVERVVPMGLMCLASYLEENGHNVTILDARLYDTEKFKKKLKSEMQKHGLVGLSVMTSQIPDALDTTDFIKQNNPDVPIVWGGCHPTLFPEQTTADKNIDFSIVGEGEAPLLNLVEHLEKGIKKLKEINNLVFKNNGNVRVNPLMNFLDINKLPYPAYHLIDPSKYIEKRHPSGRIIKSIEFPTSRGCPHRCGFCINQIVCRRIWRPMNVENSIRMMDFVLQKFKTNHIYFFEDCFFPNKERVRSILKHIFEQGYDITWDTTCRVDYFDHFDKPFLELMQKTHCIMLRMGMESGSQRVLDYMHKDITPEQSLNAVRLCVKYDIQPFISYMMGLPTETREEMEMTLKLAWKIREIAPNVFWSAPQVFRPYPGGDLYEDCKKQGLIEPDSLRGWVNFQSMLTGYIDALNWVQEKKFVKDILFWMTIMQKWGLYKNVKPKTVGEWFKKQGVKTFAKIANWRWKHGLWKFPIDSRLILFLFTKGVIHK